MREEKYFFLPFCADREKIIWVWFIIISFKNLHSRFCVLKSGKLSDCLCLLLEVFFFFFLHCWKTDSVDIWLITWQWQYSHHHVRLHSGVGMRRSCGGIFKDSGVSTNPSESPDSAVHNQLGQLAWEPADVPRGSLNGSRRLAVQLYPLLASLPQTTLLVWAPSPLLCLQPVCCFTLRQCGIASSFVLLFPSIAAVMRHCTTVVCFIILIPVMDLFMQSVEYLCFVWLENDELSSEAMFILLMRFYSIKKARFSYI